MPRLDVSTIYGHGSQKPIVELRLPRPSAKLPEHERKRNLVQMSVEEARDLALNLLAAAESAIQDAFLMDFAREGIGLDDRTAAALLDKFRMMRRDRQSDDAA
jgi:hypothetical protein